MSSGYKNFNVRRGLPKGFVIFILALAITGAAWVPTSALAASIGCGQCHGTAALSSNPAEQATGHRTGYESTPGYEDQKTVVDVDICTGKGRGLHGIHMNYSSASYGGSGTNTILGSTYIRHGNCNYCHNKHPHENGFIEFSGMSATARQKVNSVGVKFSGTGMGPNGVDINQMDGVGTCTSACHKGTSASNPAPWGNYTSPSIKLSCDSCHDDVTKKDAGTFSLSGAHKQHLQSAITVNGGSVMGAAGNTGCVNCHPDNTGEGKLPRGTSDFGAVKAYPHASDGTEVAFDNASVIAKLGATKAGLNTTCTGSCHNNSSGAKWGDASLSCDSCHYYADPPTHDGNETAAVKLTGSHSSHFSAGKVCGDCHPVPSSGDTSHAHSLPPNPQNATLLAALNWNGTTMTCSDGTCHTTSPVWGTTASCTSCHASAQGTRRSTQTDFSLASHHISGSWSAMTATDCAACHAEGNYADGSKTSYHTGIPGKPVYLKQWTGQFPSTGSNGTFTVISTTALTRSAANTYILTPFCLGCHSDANKAATPFIAAGDTRTPTAYSWDYNSVGSKYSNISTTPWGKFNSSSYNVVPADMVTKSFSAHGNATNNQMAKSLASYGGTITATSNVQCYDCHNSHGSGVTGGTSYASGNTAGGLIYAASGRNGATYTPAAGGSTGTKNTYSASSDLCFDCHLGESGTGEPKNYRTYGVPSGKAIVGYYDRVGISNFNNYSSSRWSTSDVWRGSFAYKDGNFKGGHFGNSLGFTQVTGMGTKINGNCTACHDPHGVSPAMKRGYTKPVQTVKHGGTNGGPSVGGSVASGDVNQSRIVVLQITANGTSTSSPSFRYSTDGGNNWTSSTGSTTILTSINITWNTGDYYVNDTWTFLVGVNPNYMAPALKGTWMHSPYKEDRAPRSNHSVAGGRLASFPRANDFVNFSSVFGNRRLWDDSAGGTTGARDSSRQVGGPGPRANPDFKVGSYVPGYNIPAIQGDGFGAGPLRNYGYSFGNITGMRGWNGYYIDENTFGTSILKPSPGTIPAPTKMVSANAAATPGNFAGLCLECHVWEKNGTDLALGNITSANLGTGAARKTSKPHETVSGLGAISVNLFTRAENWSSGAYATGSTSQTRGHYEMHGMNMTGQNYSYSYQGPSGRVMNGSSGGDDYSANPARTTNGHYYRWGVPTNQRTLNTVTADYHQFPCSKCHTPHVSRLPRLMKTNCLDNDGTNTTDMAYVSNTKTLDTNKTKLWGALFRNVACHSTKVGGTSSSNTSNPYTEGGWNNLTPW